MFLLLIFLAGITSPLYAFKLNISKAEMTLEVGQQGDFYVQGFSGTGWLEYKSSVVTVVDKASVKIESVTLVPSVLNLEVGEEIQLNVKITPADANLGDVVLGY